MISSFPFIATIYSTDLGKKTDNPFGNKQLQPLQWNLDEAMTIIYRRWIHGVKRKLLRFHRRRPDGSRLKSNEDQEIVQSLRTGKVKGVLEGEEEEEEYADVKEMRWALKQAVNLLSREEMAAIKIQACFRGHLARRAFRALKGLVRLQAVFRGYRVRQQARIALRCMNSLAKLQVRIRNRQQLTGPIGSYNAAH